MHFPVVNLHPARCKGPPGPEKAGGRAVTRNGPSPEPGAAGVQKRSPCVWLPGLTTVAALGGSAVPLPAVPPAVTTMSGHNGRRPLPNGSRRGIWQGGWVRIQGDGNAVSDLLIFLTRDEAAELRDGPEDLLANFDHPGWHAHVSRPDFQIEMTIAPETLSK